MKQHQQGGVKQQTQLKKSKFQEKSQSNNHYSSEEGEDDNEINNNEQQQQKQQTVQKKPLKGSIKQELQLKKQLFKEKHLQNDDEDNGDEDDGDDDNYSSNSEKYNKNGEDNSEGRGGNKSNSSSYSEIDCRTRRRVQSPIEREEILFMAKLAEQIENFEQMAEFMRKIITIDKNSDTILLKEDEIDCLNSAFFNIIGKRRVALRAMKNYETKEKQKDNHAIETVKWYRKKIEEETYVLCNEIIEVIERQLDKIDNQSDLEAIVSLQLLKMKGDYNRYLCDLTDGELQQKVIDEAFDAYQSAWEVLQEKEKENQSEQLKQQISKIPKIHPLRIGVGLNLSVFYFEIKDDILQAYTIAKDTFEQTIGDKEVIDFEEESYKNCITPIQLLRQNMKMWEEIIKQKDFERPNSQIA